ncbi:MAG: hypothetical protein ABIT83_20585 [Massilia sp.]
MSAAASRSWTGPTLIAVVVFAACWSGALLFWRAAGRTPSALDLGQLLLALPMAILLACWLARQSMTRTAPAIAPAATPAVPAPAPPHVMPTLIAGALRVPHGDTAAALAEAIASNTAHCALDKLLKDQDGFPVTCGRIDEVDADAQRELMTPWLAQRGLAELEFTDAQWRALAIADPVVAELGFHATQHPLLAGFMDSAEDQRTQHPLPMLELQLSLSPGWDAAQREAVQDWLLHRVAQQGWPAQRLRAGAPMSLLEALGASNPAPSLRLLFACESHLDEATVVAWEDQKLLHTASNARGQIPGEGAAGLLLGDAEQARLMGNTVTLHGLATSLRPESADRGAVTHTLLQQLVHQALDGSQLDAASVAMLCADTDARPSRSVELLSVAGTVLPHLEQATHAVRLGAICGNNGQVGQLAALVLAQHATVVLGGPVLWVSNLDPFQRAAMVVRSAAS